MKPTTFRELNNSMGPKVTPIEDSFLYGLTAPAGPGPPHCRGFITTFRHSTFGRTPLGEWSFCRRELLLGNTQHSRQTSIPPAGFEPTIPSS